STDLDGDGDYDVLSASLDDDKIAWYENTDGLGTFGPQQVITTSANGACSVFSVDLDGDGDKDVLSASFWDSKIAWYENTNGLGTFGSQQVITTSADNAKTVHSADLDGDGDYDVLSGSEIGCKIAWYENMDGQGSFGPQQIFSTNVGNSLFSADLDGDGDNDVLSASGGKIAWYRNDGPLGFRDAEPGNNPIPGFSYSIHPNPFNPTTTISFDLPVASFVVLDVFDINGRNVGARHASPMSGSGATPTTGFYSPGTHSITFDGSDLPSGIYFVRLEAGENSSVGKIVLLK
ncbi:MAG: T9SS type A sorting domain-containing protein, partial [bacterium]